jgi:hypothetical protein
MQRAGELRSERLLSGYSRYARILPVPDVRKATGMFTSGQNQTVGSFTFFILGDTSWPRHAQQQATPPMPSLS